MHSRALSVPVDLDPLREASRQRWLARARRWRARPREAATLAAMYGACLAFGACLAVWMAERGGAVLLGLLRRHPWPAALLLAATLATSARRGAVAFARHVDRGWLAALAQTTAHRGAALRRLALRNATATLATLATLASLLHWLHPDETTPSLAYALFVAATVLAAVPVLMPTRRAVSATPSRRAVSARRELPVEAAWQLARATAGVRGRSGAWKLLPLLLMIPAGIHGFVQLALLVLVMALGAVFEMWLRSMDVAYDATRLLRAQPATPVQHVQRWLWLPATAVFAAACVVLGLGLAMGSPWLSAGVACAGVAMAALHAATTFASARAGSRVMPRMLLHATIAWAALAMVAPLMPLVFATQLAWLWRGARRR